MCLNTEYLYSENGFSAHEDLSIPENTPLEQDCIAQFISYALISGEFKMNLIYS